MGEMGHRSRNGSPDPVTADPPGGCGSTGGLLDALSLDVRKAFGAECSRAKVRKIVAVPNTPAARVVVESESGCAFCGHTVCVFCDTASFASNTRLFCDACGAPWTPV